MINNKQQHSHEFNFCDLYNMSVTFLENVNGNDKRRMITRIFSIALEYYNRAVRPVLLTVKHHMMRVSRNVR